MRSGRRLMVGAFTVISLLAGAVHASSVSSDVKTKPSSDERIHLPYVRLYPSQLEVPKPKFRERMLLKKDDGSMEIPSLLSAGHALTFKKPPGVWLLSGVVVYLGRLGHPEADEGFKIYVCDADRRPLASVWRPKSRVRLGDPTWYLIPFPPTQIPEDFMVIVDLSRRSDDRSIVYIGSDTSEATAKPQMAEPNGAYYELERIGTWMIRAVVAGDGNRPEDMIDARIVPDQKLNPAPKDGLKAYRSPKREMKWVSKIPKLPAKTGRLELAWDQKDVTVGIRYLGKRGSMLKVFSKSLTVDLPVNTPGVFEVSILRRGYLPAVKRFTVAPGNTYSWKVELKVHKAGEETAI